MAISKSQISSSMKLAGVVLSILITFAGALYAVEDRYVTQEEAATSLQNFNNAIKKDLVNIELQILYNSLDNVNDQYYKLRRLIQESPSDPYLNDEFRRIKERRKNIQEKINEKIDIH